MFTYTDKIQTLTTQSLFIWGKKIIFISQKAKNICFCLTATIYEVFEFYLQILVCYTTV